MIDRSNWDDEKFYQFRVIKGWPEQNWGDPEVDGVNEKDFPRHRMEWLAAVLRDSYLLYSILETPNPDMEAGWSFERNLPRNLRRAAEVLHIVYQLQNELLDFLEGELAKKPDIAAAA
jgi:hypothetical protein